jgi:hypothetical protein
MGHWHPLTKRFYFAKESKHPNNDIPERANEIVQFVQKELRFEVLPKIIWISPVLPSAAFAVLGNQVDDFRKEDRNPLFARRRKDIREGYTPINVDQNEIWIRQDLSIFPNLEFVLAHELRHAWQKLYSIEVFRDHSRSECDAYRYGYDALKRYLVDRGQLTKALDASIASEKAQAEAEFCVA